jgi:flagellar basal-body rod protein FlgG
LTVSEIYAIALAAMHQDMGQLDRIAQNLANAGTPGYKRVVAAARPFGEEVDALSAVGSESPLLPGRAPPLSITGAGVLQLLTDRRGGTLRTTGQPLDLALEGDGYFEVKTEAGPAYTRQGSFTLDAERRLVTAQGQAVMGTDGEIRLATATPVIDAAGKITEPDATGTVAAAPGAIAPSLRIVHFETTAELRDLGDGLVAPGPGASPQGRGSVESEPTRVRQGALENSNVSSMQEMVQLIQTMRHFESLQRIVQGYDDLLSTSIRKLGDLS